MQSVVMSKEKRAALKRFDELLPYRPSRISMRPALLRDLGKLRDLAQDRITADVASIETLKTAQRYNPNSIFVFEQDTKIVGVYAILMLSATGLEDLLVGDLDLSNPAIEALAHPSDRPAAIYHWAVVAPRLAIEGLCQISHFLQQSKYRHANYYARPATDEGAKLMTTLGFEPVKSATPNLHRYVRVANQTIRRSLAA